MISLSLSQCGHNITFTFQDMRGPGLVELVAEHPSWVNNQISPFHLLSSCVFEHLSSHFSKSLTSIFFQFGKGISDVIFELANELLSGIAQRIDISKLREHIDLNVFI